MQGAWSGYVENDLIPRLNGFELLMASYAMAHLKLDLLLRETGYKAKPTTDADAQRFKIFLTNSLEPGISEVPNLFMAQWLTDESIQASQVKEDTPVMVILGNPPYSGISINKGKWITDLIEDYKYVDGVHFNERKHWLNDDYVKFMRYGQHFIEKNGEGILAFINPHGFLDNPTFRGMRWHLLKTYDKIYTIDLHGNAKKKETTPDGSVDQNIFDIMQGVSINILIKTGKKKPNELGQVLHYDLYGKRNLKYDFLIEKGLKTIDFKELKPQKPYFFFIPKNNEGREFYNEGINLSKLFETVVTGIVTAKDKVVTDFDKEVLLERINKFCNDEYSDDEIRSWLFPNKKEGKYLIGDSRGWKLSEARKEIKNNLHDDFIKVMSYRPFDNRVIYYSPKMVDWGREKVMQHFIDGDNIGLVFSRQATDENWTNIQITSSMIDNRYHFSYKGIPNQAPLYLYETKDTLFTEATRKPNLDPKIVTKIAKGLGLRFTAEKETETGTFAPIDILDYIYAVLHSPTYRETYKEFLKIDFPRVPFPEKATFWALVKLGGELRQLHLLEFETSDIEESDAFKASGSLATYPEDGDNIVTRKMTSKNIGYAATSDTHGNVWINDTQYFENVPLVAWEFYIGGYQPAQKWLKDRKERELSYDDIQHYGKIIVALTETDRIMKAIDGVSIE
jgi:predicted helicase